MEQPKHPEIEDELESTDSLELEPGASRPEPLGGEVFEDAEVQPGVEGRGLTDVLRKAMVAGLGAVFMTEEGIRTYVKDLKLPKDMMGFVVGQAERSKAELFRVIGEELRRFFEGELLRRELTRLLSQMTLEVHAEIRLKPSGSEPEPGEGVVAEPPEPPKPEIKVRSAKVRRRTRKKKS